MDFYESISAYYDYIFPVDPQTVGFLARHSRKASRVLDLACGTGGYAVELARLGHRVMGVDLDAAMLRLAQAKAAGTAAVEFRVLDMREAGRRLDPGFGLVFCIGNSLVHLESEVAIAALLGDCRRLLEPGGALVVQIIHYDRVLARRVMELPTLRCERPALQFVRRYEYAPGDSVVQFRTELTVHEPAGPRTVSNVVPLWILTREALERVARSAGFRRLEWFGGFGGESLGPDSLPLILCAYEE
jgi:glycine/sarcosine N-methyltransferase